MKLINVYSSVPTAIIVIWEGSTTHKKRSLMRSCRLCPELTSPFANNSSDICFCNLTFSTVPYKRIHQYVTFHFWYLLFSIMLMRIINVARYTGSLFFLMPGSIPWYDVLFCLCVHQLMEIENTPPHTHTFGLL